MQYTEIDAQQLQIKLRHEPRPAAEGIEAEYLAAARAKPGRRPLGFEVRLLLCDKYTPCSEACSM